VSYGLYLGIRCFSLVMSGCKSLPSTRVFVLGSEFWLLNIKKGMWETLKKCVFFNCNFNEVFFINFGCKICQIFNIKIMKKKKHSFHLLCPQSLHALGSWQRSPCALKWVNPTKWGTFPKCGAKLWPHHTRPDLLEMPPSSILASFTSHTNTHTHTSPYPNRARHSILLFTFD